MIAFSGIVKHFRLKIFIRIASKMVLKEDYRPTRAIISNKMASFKKESSSASVKYVSKP